MSYPAQIRPIADDNDYFVTDRCSDVPRQFRLGRECQEKVTNYFIFDELYFPGHKETMMRVASNCKLIAILQKEN